MGIEFKPTFTMADIRRRLDRAESAIYRATFERLSYMGEECVIRARSIAPAIGFHDQTGNLRSSIGYVLAYNGNVVKEGKFDKVISGTKGVITGKILAADIAKQHSNGWVLVVVAGMKYAVHLETRGRDVLTSTEHFAEQEIKVVLQTLKSRINAMKV